MSSLQVEDSYVDSYSFRLKIFRYEEWINSMEGYAKLLIKSIEEIVKVNKGKYFTLKF